MRAAALVLGVILLVLGGLVAAGVFKYETTEKVVDLGPIELSATETKTAPLNLGWMLLGAGTVLVVVGVLIKKK
jgi:hypothetical protein